MAKKNVALEAAIAEEVRKEIGKLQATGQIPSPDEIDDSEITDSTPTSQVKKMFSSFPSTEGYYGKIWKVKSDGAWEVKDYRIEAPESVPDLELEVTRIVKEKGWGSGKYVVQVQQTGKRGFAYNKHITIGDPTPEERAEGRQISIPRNIVTEQLSTMKETVQAVKEFMPPSTTAKDILDAVDKGREMSKLSGGNGQDGQLSVILEVVNAVKELFPKTQPADVDTIIEKVVARLQPKEDFFQSLIKYQEAILKLNPPEKREREIDSIKKVTDIVQAIRPLTGGAAAAPSSWIELLIEHGSKLVEPIITTLKDFAEAKKTEMQLRLQGYNPTLIPSLAQPKTEAGGIKLMHPFVARTLKAITENDESYFEPLRQRIFAMGPHFIEGLITGELTIDFIIEIANEIYGLPTDNPNIKPYFDKFAKWLKNRIESEVMGKSREEPTIKEFKAENLIVVGRCGTCGEEYEFKTIKEWEVDNKKCGDSSCDGRLELVKEE